MSKSLITINGEEAYTTNLPDDWTQDQVDQYQQDAEGLFNAADLNNASAREAGERLQRQCERFDPKNEKGRGLFWEDGISDMVAHICTVKGKSRSWLTKQHNKVREDLDPTDPWYLDPDRETEGKGRPKKTKEVKDDEDEGGITEDTRDVGELTPEQLAQATVSVLKNLDGKKLKDPVGFMNTLDDLSAAIVTASSVAAMRIRQS